MNPNDSVWPPKTTHLRVESLLIDLRFRRVIRQNETVELSRRVFDLLLVFMSEPHVLHTRSALFERVWPKLLVDDANLSQSIWMLRRALGDENKSWIRTVAKSGYVFEPPGPVSIATLPGQPDGAELSNPGAPAKTADAPVVTAVPHSALRRSRSGHLWTLWKRLTMAASLACLSAIAGSHADGVRSGTSIAAVRVVLIRVNDDTTEADLEWTLRLLDTWLAWKLDSLPETVRMTQEDLTSDELSYPPRVVLLMVGRPQGRPDQVFVRASLNGTSVRDGLPAPAGSDAGRQIELRGSIADVPHMVDAISKQTLAQLLPHRASDRWPSLLLSTDEAKKYVEAAEAIHRREWSKALSSAEDVVQSAPDFGPARLLLAQALNRYGETRMATEQMLAARRHISPLPADAEAVLDAQRLITTTGSHFEANAAYAALSARYPERAEFALGHAKTLIQSSKPDAALEILSRPEWSQKPRRIRIHHAIALAEAEMAYGRTAIAAKHAQRAIDLIGKTQEGWEIDLGTAQLLLATANHSLYDREHSSDEYENAARTFQSGGAKLDALHAKFLAEITRQNSSGEARVMEILEEVRSIGDRRLEIEILLNMASIQFSYGDNIDGKRNLQQALTVANMAGDDIAQQIVEVKLVREDIFAGNFSRADQRISRITEAGKLWGRDQLQIAQYKGMMEMLTGNYDRSLASLEQSETQGIKFDSSQPPRAIARIACLRGKSLMAKGDLLLARQQISKCRYKPSGTLMRTASSLEVWVELLAGNKEEAAEIAAKSENMLDGMHENTDRWTLGLSLADALVRLGEHARAERIYLAIASPSLQAGYEMLTANAETGLAEIAAVRRDWKKSRRYADMARHRVPKNLWSITHRLDQIEIVHAYKRGDRNTSKSMLLALNAEAEKNGDVVVQTELDTMTSMMIENDNRDSRRARADRPKLRGATLNWLTSDQLSPAVSSAGHH